MLDYLVDGLGADGGSGRNRHVKKAKKKVYQRRIKACAKSPTLEDVVEAAHKAGATVSVGLVPIGSGIAPIALVPEPPEPPKHDVPEANWPGDPSCRSIIAHYAPDREIAQVFKDNPTSQWVITPHVIEEREAFMQRWAANQKPKATAKTP